MAVYTEVTFEEAAALFDSVGLGALQALSPCKGGIENTNYFADTTAGSYVVTIFERLRADELPFYLQLMKHHADHALPVPRPYPGADGSLVLELAGKPATVVDRLPGQHHLAPDADDCASVGAMLARLHASARDFAPAQPNLRGLAWWSETVPVVVPYMGGEQAALMLDELAFQRHLAASSAYATLPRAAIHGDLFRDNAMFVEKRLAGVFDFYFAGVDTLLFDIAVCLNDWCIDLASGRLAEDRAAALVAAYESLRPLETAEVRLLPAVMRAAAFRFWLSRAWDQHLPRDAVILTAHDPDHFERVLAQRREAPLASGACAAGTVVKLQLVAPRQGALWVRKGLQVFGRQPLGFASLFAAWLFVSGVLRLIPFVGTIAGLILLPTGSLGFMIASRRVDSRLAAMPGAIVELVNAGPDATAGAAQARPRFRGRVPARAVARRCPRRRLVRVLRPVDVRSEDDAGKGHRTGGRPSPSVRPAAASGLFGRALDPVLARARPRLLGRAELGPVALLQQRRALAQQGRVRGLHRRLDRALDVPAGDPQHRRGRLRPRAFHVRRRSAGARLHDDLRGDSLVHVRRLVLALDPVAAAPRDDDDVDPPDSLTKGSS